MNIYLFKTIRDHIMKEKQTAWKVVDDDDDDNDNNNESRMNPLFILYTIQTNHCLVCFFVFFFSFY